jgi:hypothetical protein
MPTTDLSVQVDDFTDTAVPGTSDTSSIEVVARAPLPLVGPVTVPPGRTRSAASP